MGYYIETSQTTGKAMEIARKFNGSIVEVDAAREAMKDNTKGVICVVKNAFFEAAGFAYDEREFEVFANPTDARPKKWVIISREIAEKASGYQRGGDYR